MKALKLKSSTKENPIWGKTVCDSISKWKYDPIGLAQEPSLFGDFFTIERIKINSEYPNLVDQWELVPVKITIA